ncbi:YiiX/YebB-like N1pC/P60 family cysteine hydrolase [Brevibacillus marinus]|uniref:YiiX/YebB-like N1pC/P60 family cysteine hydrolase n=1 Tax=Brevibacillus marinus TaxID=2496837 RepID=UPI000F8205E8|nr:YiiX/YebB-like N1pC/P60 family cysteine hydrolase [Brevibacillus marinus]
MRRYLSLTLSFIFAFILWSGNLAFAAEKEVTQENVNAASFTAKPGDIFYMNKSSNTYFVGHVAIAISSTTLVEIIGPGDHPHTTSIQDFYNRRGNSAVKVYRYSDSSKAAKAATWAKNYQINYSDAEYGFDSLLNYETGKMYCSKLVYCAYYYGADVRLNTSYASIGGATLKISTPSDITSSSGMSLVYTLN